MKKISAILFLIAFAAAPAWAAEGGETNSCIDDLRSDNPEVQISGAECLGENKDKEGINPLLDVLRTTSDTEVAVSCAKALAAINDSPATVGGLLAALDSVENATTKYGIVAALAVLTTDENKADVQAALDRVEVQTDDELLKDLAVRVRTLISGS